MAILKSHLLGISYSFHFLVKKLSIEEPIAGRNLPVILLWALITTYL